MSKFVVETWPDSQTLMEKKGFHANAFLVNDDRGIEIFGSSAYFVNEDWLNENEGEDTPTNDESHEDTYELAKQCFDCGEIVDIDNPFRLSGSDLDAVGFVIDSESRLMIISTPTANCTKYVKDIDKNELTYTDFFSLAFEDRDEIARILDNDEYTIQ